MRYSLLVLLFAISASCFSQYSIGNKKFIFKDPARSNRSILTFVYYPATADSSNAPIIDDGTKFPVVSFGHGFVMSALAYQWLANALVPYGYIVAFPSTEEGVPPNHSDFGKDEVFVARTLRNQGDSANSFLYNKINGYTAVGGHSMGGGASFLGMQYVSDITTFFNFSAAETFITESAIQSARNCTQPALVFCGTKDCIAPAVGNSKFMYNNLQSGYKFFANIHDASHCQFGDPNKTPCEAGEAFSCPGSVYISESDQKNKVLLLLKPWLDFWLKRDCAGIEVFYDDVIANLSNIDTMQSAMINCNALSPLTALHQNKNIKVDIFPNPSNGKISINIGEADHAVLVLSDLNGKEIDRREIKSQNQIELNYSNLSQGIYMLKVETKKGTAVSKLVISH